MAFSWTNAGYGALAGSPVGLVGAVPGALIGGFLGGKKKGRAPEPPPDARTSWRHLAPAPQFNGGEGAAPGLTEQTGGIVPPSFAPAGGGRGGGFMPPPMAAGAMPGGTPPPGQVPPMMGGQARGFMPPANVVAGGTYLPFDMPDVPMNGRDQGGMTTMGAYDPKTGADQKIRNPGRQDLGRGNLSDNTIRLRALRAQRWG